MPVYSVRQFGSSFSSGPGSSTAPDSECAPTAEAFSSTQMLISGLSCFSRIAAGKSRGACADDHDVILHHFAFDMASLICVAFGIDGDRAVSVALRDRVAQRLRRLSSCVRTVARSPTTTTDIRFGSRCSCAACVTCSGVTA